jgi:hypothetical protein
VYWTYQWSQSDYHNDHFDKPYQSVDENFIFIGLGNRMFGIEDFYYDAHTMKSITIFGIEIGFGFTWIAKEFKENVMTNFFQVGRMVGASKSGYISAHPGNVILFNANIFTKEDGKVWYGDLDLTKDSDALKNLARESSQRIKQNALHFKRA